MTNRDGAGHSFLTPMDSLPIESVDANESPAVDLFVYCTTKMAQAQTVTKVRNGAQAVRPRNKGDHLWGPVLHRVVGPRTSVERFICFNFTTSAFDETQNYMICLKLVVDVGIGATK